MGLFVAVYGITVIIIININIIIIIITMTFSVFCDLFSTIRKI